MRRPIFYDTETTGVKAEVDRVIEIAAYDLERDRSFERLINPGVPIPAEATAVHKITDEMVANAPTFEEIIDDFVAFCDGDAMLVAHNNDGFDIHFLRAEFGRCDQSLPAEWSWFDTLRWSRKYRSDLPSHSLQYLREVYGFEANNAHRALDDVIILKQVYQAMTLNLTADQAWELMQQADPLPTKMPFGKHQGKALADVPGDYIKWLAKSGALDKPQNEALRKSLEKLELLSGAPA
jgi:DNA polymerase-3 subunit epsilon